MNTFKSSEQSGKVLLAVLLQLLGSQSQPHIIFSKPNDMTRIAYLHIAYIYHTGHIAHFILVASDPNTLILPVSNVRESL